MTPPLLYPLYGAKKESLVRTPLYVRYLQPFRRLKDEDVWVSVPGNDLMIQS